MSEPTHGTSRWLHDINSAHNEDFNGEKPPPLESSHFPSLSDASKSKMRSTPPPNLERARQMVPQPRREPLFYFPRPLYDCTPEGMHHDFLRYGVAMDGEWTGDDLALNGMTQFGFAWVDLRGERVLSTFSSYTALDEGVAWNEQTLREFWLDPLRPQNRVLYERTLEALKSAPTKKQAGVAFMAWFNACMKRFGSDGVLLSDTGGNDWARIARILPAGVSFQSIFGDYRPSRDTSSFFMGVAGCTTYESVKGSERRALDALGIAQFPDFGYNELHNPMHDAANIALRFAFIQNQLLESRGIRV